MLSIAIPSSALINENDPKIKTFKVGLIGRACAIFRVEEILIYKDPLLDESDFIKDILEYMNTPQYLRKYLIPIKPTLRYAGVLPPLRIPSHKPKRLKIGEIRDGVIKQLTSNGTYLVDIGLDSLALLKSKSKLKKGERVTVRVCSRNPLIVKEAEPDDYWGFKVRKVKLNDLLKRKNIIITSKMCQVVSLDELRQSLKNDITLVFGSPKEDVFEIASRLGININAKCWNTIPNQGVESVRLEEAIYITLGIVNIVRRWFG